METVSRGPPLSRGSVPPTVWASLLGAGLGLPSLGPGVLRAPAVPAPRAVHPGKGTQGRGAASGPGQAHTASRRHQLGTGCQDHISEALGVRLTCPGAPGRWRGRPGAQGLPLSPRAEWLSHRRSATKPHLGKGEREEGEKQPPTPSTKKQGEAGGSEPGQGVTGERRAPVCPGAGRMGAAAAHRRW